MTEPDPRAMRHLREQFFCAFASRPRPSADGIVKATVSRHESDGVRNALAAREPAQLAEYELRTVIGGNLGMLTPEAFLYFLPGFLRVSLESYSAVNLFAFELLSALTGPTRDDVVQALDRLAKSPPGVGFPADLFEQIRKQQLEWADSGAREALFRERFDALTPAEGAAILAFLDALRQAHGADFSFGEIDAAVDRRWGRYRDV